MLCVGSLRSDLTVATPASRYHGAVVAGTLETVERLASRLGLSAEDLTLYGSYRAKIRLDPTPPRQARKGRYVLVTGITPTRHNAGKTVTTIGLAMGLERIGHPRRSRSDNPRSDPPSAPRAEVEVVARPGSSRWKRAC